MNQDLKEVCKDIRCDVMTCIGHLGVGHIGGCLSLVELLAVLYFQEMNIDPKQPQMAGPPSMPRWQTAVTSTAPSCSL